VSPHRPLFAHAAREFWQPVADDLDARALRRLEERLADTRMYEPTDWASTEHVDGLDRACAYPFLRTTTERPAKRSGRHPRSPARVQPALCDDGLDAVAGNEEQSVCALAVGKLPTPAPGAGRPIAARPTRL
jgi:hypothetical protein